jgi:serine/threonine-protein kinase HipA
MNLCPISYEPCGELLYSKKGLKMLSPALKDLANLEFSAEELREEAFIRASKMSIQGVQPKLSAVLNIRHDRFDIVDKKGRFIMKPQHHIFPELPQNEDLTMRLAAMAGIEIPLHGMVYSRDHSLTYFIRRFDRKGQKDKIAVEEGWQGNWSCLPCKFPMGVHLFLRNYDTIHKKPRVNCLR